MGKRFIDTELFNDEWFSELPKDAKLLWVYIITRCDHAGLLKWNIRLIEFQTGINSLVTVIEQLSKNIVWVNDHLIFCPKFLSYQYPDFPKSKFRAALSAIELLKKENLLDADNNLITAGKETVSKDLTKSYGNGNGNGNGIGNGKKGVQGEKPKKTFVAPSLDEVKAYFVEKGYSETGAEKAFNYYSVANWIDSKGNPVKNWKQKMQGVWFKDEYKIPSAAKLQFAR